jgi:hypothetical protein
VDAVAAGGVAGWLVDVESGGSGRRTLTGMR